jgi:hypothetical protein
MMQFTSYTRVSPFEFIPASVDEFSAAIRWKINLMTKQTLMSRKYTNEPLLNAINMERERERVRVKQ